MTFSAASCQNSRDNKHEDEDIYISYISTHMAKPSYRDMLKDDKYTKVKGFDDRSYEIVGNAISIGGGKAGREDSDTYRG